MTPTVTPAAPKGYNSFLTELKDRIRHAQLRAALSVNRELVLLYWSIGRDILTRQKEQGWGAKVIDRVASDLRKAFPQMTGFSPRNLKYMRAFAEAWPDEQFVQQVAAQIPWFHNCVLLDQVKNPGEREWYIRQTIENGWSRNVLVHQIESGLYLRQGKALTNFTRTLPAPQSELAQQIVKDPYNFDFLTLSREAQERELERGLLDHIRDFLLELGIGFAFMGSQYPLQVGGEEFRIDLVFYHVKLRAYVIIDLLCGAPHKRSSVAFPVMWRSVVTGQYYDGAGGTERHISKPFRESARTATGFCQFARAGGLSFFALRREPGPWLSFRGRSLRRGLSC
jgi:predicted nuclease of restriction endonuclease-like (RecB) superfamily